MALLESTLLLMVLSSVDCQIQFPSSEPNQRGSGLENSLNDCFTNDNQPGTCYEFRSIQFKQCSFFPSVDLSKSAVSQHLRDNVCRNSGREIYFCCPNNTPTQPPVTAPPTIVPSSMMSLRPSVIPSEEECGNPNSFNVIGGEISAQGAWPWLAAIGQKIGSRIEPFCGGTLISKQHVITAAHCFKRQRNFAITVRLGEYDVREEGEGVQDFSIADMRIGNYNETTKENDIIMLKLDRPLISYTDRIKPACLPYHLRDENFEGDSPLVVGWGVFDFDDELGRRTSDVPLQAQVPVVPIPECQQSYRLSGSVIDNRQMCAGRGMTDACTGDSGGPLNYIDAVRARFFVIGLVSFGPTNCGNRNLPGVYLRIGYYLDWIEENIRQLS